MFIQRSQAIRVITQSLPDSSTDLRLELPQCSLNLFALQWIYCSVKAQLYD